MDNSNIPTPQPINLNQPLPVQVNIPLPLIYTNGVLVGMTAADIQLTITINGRPTNVVAMNISAAKNLIGGLQKAIEDYEKKTKTKVLDLNEIGALLNPNISK